MSAPGQDVGGEEAHAQVPVGYALVQAALAPVYADPNLPATLISQIVMGARVEVVEERAAWRLVRAEDGYVGWVHSGYLIPGNEEWVAGWERGTRGEPVVSLGAELADENGWVFARPPWGARLFKYGALYGIPDGRTGTPVRGEIVDIDRRTDRYPPRGVSMARTARGWLGTPYLWGGVTPAGADCSGFMQAVLWMHGLALPRDSAQQAEVGQSVEPGPDFEALRPGDLLYFAERDGLVTHVALSTGGSRIVHAALTNGGVAENDLGGEELLDRRLRSEFVGARRLLPDD